MANLSASVGVPAASVRVPADWESTGAVWLAWPHQRETWPGRFAPIPAFFASWARCISESTPVRILAAGPVATQCQAMMAGATQVEIVDIATNDCWIRDYGPTFVKRSQVDSPFVKQSRVDSPSGLTETPAAKIAAAKTPAAKIAAAKTPAAKIAAEEIAAVDWRYNAWGGKYQPWDADNAAARKICEQSGIACVDGGLCLEGGALEFDGHGRLLTTPACLVTDNRNPGLTAEVITQQLHQHLGALEIAWIDGGGLAGDDTDGHIDQLARFIDRENVVVATCEDPHDPNYESLETNFRQLHLWGDATTPRVRVHRLPIPPARHVNGQRLPESYCNFLRLGPERILVPTFDAPSDDAALGLLKELSGADAVGVDCRDLVWGLGSLHCASLNQPAAETHSQP